MNALIDAVIEGNMQAVKHQLKQPEVNVNERDHLGRTALTRSIEQEHTVITQLLLDAGADVNLG